MWFVNKRNKSYVIMVFFWNLYLIVFVLVIKFYDFKDY